MLGLPLIGNTRYVRYFPTHLPPIPYTSYKSRQNATESDPQTTRQLIYDKNNIEKTVFMSFLFGSLDSLENWPKLAEYLIRFC